MAHTEQKLNIASQSSALEVSAQPQVQAVAAQFSGRGLSKAVACEVKEQIAREKETRSIAPGAYRLGLLNDTAVGNLYRRGKESMTSTDLIRYFQETRAMRTKHEDFSQPSSQQALINAEEGSAAGYAVIKCEEGEGALEKLSRLPAQIRKLPAKLAQTVRTSAPAWFNQEKINTEQESRRFPLSAFAALLAVAMSLMMIVASAVMINQGEQRVNALTLELTEMSGEVAELKSDLSVKNDMLGIRDYAVNELGMVEERYLQMQYLSLGSADSIEAFEEEKEQTIGISALLSALGVK
jgi:hypothetical protein